MKAVDLLDEAARLGASGTPAALATVLRTAGSTPRHPGAKMIVRADGSARGTIGGGRIEHEMTARAAAVAAGAPPERAVRELGRDLAMCCGGRMEIWIEPLEAGRGAALAEAAARRAARVPCALVTELDGRGKNVVADDECLRTRRPRLDQDRFWEPILPVDRLVLFGAGHVAAALAPLARAVGFEVIVCDEDDRFAAEERFPGARLLPTFDAREAAAALRPFGPGDFVVIATRDHAVDQAVIEALLPLPWSYLGLIGSRAKVARFRRRLEAKGARDDASWARLAAPVGLDIGAETPEEIAVAIVAQLIQARHR
jgi:xanthine dehydrogenase accessory factor